MAADKAPNFGKNDKVFDVERPGKTPASATSRPVIVGHGSVLRDPMVTKGNDQPAEPAPAPVHTSKVIEPPKESVDTTAPAKSSENEPIEPAVEPPKAEAPVDESVASDAIDKIASGAVVKNDAAVAEKAAVEKQAAVQKLIDDKTYVVPISHVKQKRPSTTTIALLLVLLVIIVGYLAIDAGLIKTDVSLPVHIIGK